MTIAGVANFDRSEVCLPERLPPFEDGATPRDHREHFLASLDAEELPRYFVLRVTARTGTTAETIAIDGEISRRSRSPSVPLTELNGNSKRADSSGENVRLGGENGIAWYD